MHLRASDGTFKHAICPHNLFSRQKENMADSTEFNDNDRPDVQFETRMESLYRVGRPLFFLKAQTILVLLGVTSLLLTIVMLYALSLGKDIRVRVNVSHVGQFQMDAAKAFKTGEVAHPAPK